MLNQKVYLLPSLFVLSGLLSSCSSLPNPHMASDPISLLQTRVAFLPSCPGQVRKAQRESVVAGVATQLVAPTIDAAYDVVLNAVTEAGSDRTETFIGQTTSRFYETTPSADGNKLQNYELFENRDNNCLVVVHGYFSSNTNNLDLSGTGLDSQTKRTLRGHFGLASPPKFYFEGKLFYSADNSAFRIKTEKIYYPERIGDHKMGARQTTMLLNFTKPGAGVDGTAFAVGKIDIGRAKELISVRSSPFNGVGGRNDIQTAFGTGYLPLPALDVGSKSMISTAKTRIDTQKTSILAFRKTLKAIHLPSPEMSDSIIGSTSIIIDHLSKNQDAILRKLTILEGEISDMGESIKSQKLRLDKDLITASYALDDIANPAASELEKAKRTKARRQHILLDEAKLAADIAMIQKKVELKNNIKALLNAQNQLNSEIHKVKIEENRLRRVVPFTLKVSIEEKRFGNPVAKFASSVLANSKEGITTAIKESIDPVKKKELENQAKVEAEALQAKKDTARINAISAIFDFRAAEVTIETLSSSVGTEKVDAEKTLELAKLNVEIACRTANELGVSPSDCAMF